MLSRPPPPSWKRDSIIGDAARMEAWTTTTTNKQRHNAWTSWGVNVRRLRMAKERLEAGTANRRTVAYVAAGRQHRYATPEESAAAHRRAIDVFNARVSVSLLAFRRAQSPGCSIPDCPLGPCDEEPLLYLLNRVGAGRWTESSAERAAADPVERAKPPPVTLCAWHYHARLCDARGVDVPVRLSSRQLGQMKIESGCSHPLHASMPYASLVPTPGDDRRVVAFLQVSHVRRGRERIRDPATLEAVYIRDLQSGEAVIHCDFCHRLVTLCEMARLHDTEYAQQQFALLLRRFPSFVQHFDESTAGFDWAAEAERLRVRRSNAHRGRRCKRKRKRHTPIDAADAAHLAAAVESATAAAEYATAMAEYARCVQGTDDAEAVHAEAIAAAFAAAAERADATAIAAAIAAATL